MLTYTPEEMTTEEICRILIVDDHPMVREAVALRVALENDFEICGQAEGEDEALELIEQTNPHVAIVDISLKQGNGIALIKKIQSRFPDVKTLVFSTHEESLFAERALRAGALGYLNKKANSANVIEAIRQVISGKRYVSPETTDRLLTLALSDGIADCPVNRLSDRELEVFQLIGEGMTTSEVAARMGISVHTIDTYREKIKQKIGARNGVELQREAVRWVMEKTYKSDQ